MPARGVAFEARERLTLAIWTLLDGPDVVSETLGTSAPSLGNWIAGHVAPFGPVKSRVSKILRGVERRRSKDIDEAVECYENTRADPTND